MPDQIALEFVPLVDQFLERVRQLAAEAQQALLPLEQGEQLRLDISEAEDSLTTLREQLSALGGAPVAVRFDAAQAEEALGELQARLASLQEVAQVAVDPAPAVAGLEEIATAAGGVAASLGAVGAAAAEVGPEVEAGTAAAAPGLANVSAAAYRAALAVDVFARQAATASEITPSLSLTAGRAAVAIEELEAAMRQAATQRGPVSPSQVATLQTLVASLQAAQGQVQALAAAQQQQAGAAGQAAGATQAAGAAAAGAGQAAAGAAGGIGALNNAMGLLINTTAFYLGMRIVRFFKDLVGGSLDAKEAMERLNAEFERSRGAGQGAASEIDLVRRTADTLGLNFQKVAEHYGKFTDTLKGSEVPVRTQQNLLLGVATALAATRRPAEDAGQVFEIFSRLAARDETQVRQLASALNTIIPGSMRIAAAALFQGEDSLARFEAAAKKGQVSSLDFLEVIGPAYIRQFQDQLPGAVDSTTASLNRLKNAEFEAQVGIGEGFAPEVHRATEEFRQFLNAAGDTPRALGETVAAFVWLATKVGEVVGSTVKFVGAIASEAVGTIYEVFAAVALGLSALAKAAHLDGVSATLKDLERDWNRTGESFIEEGDRMLAQSNALSAGLLGIEPASQKAGLGLDDLKARGKDLEGGINEQVSAIERQVAAIHRQAEALGLTGPVAREAADDLVKSIDKELKAIEELPVAERKALAARKGELDALRVHFEQFTTAYLRLQEQQVKSAEDTAKKEAAALQKREETFAKFLQKIQADEDKAQKDRQKNAESLQKKLAGDTAELGGLEHQGGLFTPEDLNRMGQLRQEIADTNAQLKQLKTEEQAAGVAAASMGTEAQQAGEKMREGFQQAIATDQSLRAALAQLGPAGRDSFAAILQGLVDLKSQGRLTQTDIDQAFRQISSVLQESGVVADHFAERLGLVSHSATTLRADLASIPPALAANTAAAGALTAANTEGAAAAASAGQAHRLNAESQKESAAQAGAAAAAEQQASSISIKRAEATSGLNDKLRIKTSVESQLRGEIEQTTSAEERAAQAQEGAAAGTITFRDHVIELDKASAAAVGSGGGVIKMGDKVVELGKSTQTTATETGKLATGATQAGTALDKTATSADRAGTAIEAAGAHLTDFQGSADGTAAAAGTIASSLAGIATSGARIPGILQPIASLLDQIGNAGADTVLQGADDALINLAPDARAAAEGVKALAAEVTRVLAPVRQLAVGLRTAQAAAAALAVDLAKDVSLCQQLKACTDALQG